MDGKEVVGIHATRMNPVCSPAILVMDDNTGPLLSKESFGAFKVHMHQRTSLKALLYIEFISIYRSTALTYFGLHCFIIGPGYTCATPFPPLAANVFLNLTGGFPERCNSVLIGPSYLLLFTTFFFFFFFRNV